MISVVLAAYNGEKFIKDQLFSILNQSYPVDEIIVMDDKSNDHTLTCVEEVIVANKTSAKISVFVNDNNLGYIRNFYEGIAKARGDYIFLSDQDDLWAVDKVKKMLEAMQTIKAEVLCSNFCLIDSEGNKLEREIIVPKFVKNAGSGVSKIAFLPLLFGNVAQGCTYCFTRKIQQIYINVACENVIHDYQIMLIGSALEKAFFINEPLIYYRLHGANQVGFSEKKNLRHIKLRAKFRKPKIAVLLKKIRNYIDVPHYVISMLILYLRLPVWKAVVKNII